MSIEPIRVLFLASTAEKSGGSFHSLLGLATTMAAQAKIVSFVVLPDHGSAEELLRDKDIPYHVVRSFGAEWPLGAKRSLRERLSHWKQRLQNAKAIRQISRLAKEKDVQLIHINTSVDEIGYYVARKCGLPFVWYVREFVKEGLGIEFYSPKKQLKHIASANRIITISHALQERYSGLIPDASISMIHNGIDVGRFDVPRKASKEGAVTLASVGRVSKLKGHYDMVDALTKLKELGVGAFRMTFVGTIDPELVEIVKQRGLEAQIRFTGFTDRVEDILSETDIYLSGHPWEAFGRAAVEAMAAGCCVIGVNNAGTKDVISDGVTGFLYPPGDINCLAKRIKECIDRPDRMREIALEGQRFARENFTVENCANKVFEIYQDVLRT